MAGRQPLIAANWKMNGSRASVSALLAGLKGGFAAAGAEMVVCAPAIYIPLAAELLSGSGIHVGAQNVSQHTAGAYTGEIAVSMLQDYGCQYVIIGHSERRHGYGETHAMVAAKFTLARASGLKVILCLGESMAEREDGSTEQVLAGQLEAVISRAGVAAFAGAVLAYEPVWAIGTGLTATPEQVQQAHHFIRLQLARYDDVIANNIRILYGGSVKAGNAAGIFAMADVDGGLIGGASLNIDDFLAIYHAI